jgi:tight adherence protein B
MVDAVRAIGAALRAGMSLPGAISFAAAEVPAPLGPQLRQVVERHGLGVPLDASLAEWAEAGGSADARLVASVLELHHRTGGDAPVVLEQVARTLADRRAARAEIRALTAQARLSGAILGLLPIGFFLFLSATSREDMAAAYRSPAGLTAIVAGLVLQALAFLWIRRLLRVEV